MPPNAPPPLLYASNTTDDDGRSCPPWLAVGWMVVMIAATWFSFRIMAEEYDQIGQPMALWLAVPAAPVNANPWQRQMQPQPAPSGIGTEVLFEIVCTLLFCTVFGAAAAAALWHWPRPMLWLLPVLALLAMIWYLVAPSVPTDRALANLILMNGGRNQVLSGSQKWSTVPMAFAVQVVGIATGLLTGRLLAGFVAMVLLPPHMRAAIMPYWTTGRPRG